MTPGVIIDDLEALDAPAATIASVLDPVMQSPAKPLLRGDWLGHSVHPVLTDVPIGTWTSAMLLDLLGQDGRAASVLVGAGLLSIPPVLATGWSDWHEEQGASPAIRRSGIVHAVTNVVGIGLQVASLKARRDGFRVRGALLTMAGLGATGAGGWLGGHLTYSKGSRVEVTT